MVLIKRKRVVSVGRFPPHLKRAKDSCTPRRSPACWADTRMVLQMRTRESLYSVPAGDHPLITEYMRAILVDWMQEMCADYCLSRETLHCAVNYVNRYLASDGGRTSKSHLQLVGVTAIFIASKLDELHHPRAEQFAITTAGAVARQHLIRFESHMLESLNWLILPKTSVYWVNVFIARGVHCLTGRGETITSSLLGSKSTFLRCMELIDSAMLYKQFELYFPSTLAAAAIVTILPQFKCEIVFLPDSTNPIYRYHTANSSCTPAAP